MIVRQFISWIRTGPAGERAEATRSLARAWLISDLAEDDRGAAEGALLMLLDDPSPLVRQAMAEVFARSAEAPAAIVQALSLDQPSIALPVLEHSPLLIDADLVDIVATGNSETQCAIARRINLPTSVSAAIAEVGSPAAALELIENAYAELAPFSWDRIVERHGHLAAIRASMLVLEGLPAATRLARLIRAGFRESTLAGVRVALEVSHETGYVDTVGGAARLRRRMVERVLTHCETDRQAAEPLLILLRRFATESAREEARMFCDELIAEEAVAPIRYELIAA